jgi:hypothetical protein
MSSGSMRLPRLFSKGLSEQMRKSTLWFWYLAVSVMLLILAFNHGAYRREQNYESLRVTAALVRDLELTDLCLFTEARYTRHPSQADFHTPFQDHPLSLEHFPSGSLVPPRNGRPENHANLD